MPQLETLHIDQALTDFSIEYKNADYMADQVAPIIPVLNRTDRYIIYGKEYLRARSAKRAPGAESVEIDFTVSSASYMAEERSLSALITDAERREADSWFDAEVDTTFLLTEALMVSMEKDVAAVATTTGNYTLSNTTTLSGTTQWSDYANSSPLTNLVTAKRSVRNQSFMRANSFIVSYDVALTLADHPSIKTLLQYTDPTVLTEGNLPPVVRGLRVIEGAAVYDSATEGQAVVGTSVWGKNAIVAYIAPAPGKRSISFMYTFEAPNQTGGGRGITVRRYRDDKRAGDVLEAQHTYDIKMTATGAAYLFAAAIA